MREDLRIIFSEWDPKGFDTLNATLSNPASSTEIRKVWEILKPVLPSPTPFQDTVKRFQRLVAQQVRYIPNALYADLSAKLTLDSQTQQALQVLGRTPQLQKLLTRGQVPKAHIIFCHAVQLNPYEIAKIHLKKTGMLFYSIHTEDHFEWQNRHAEYDLTQTTFNKAPAALLMNHRVSSFWTNHTVHMLTFLS